MSPIVLPVRTMTTMMTTPRLRMNAIPTAAAAAAAVTMMVKRARKDRVVVLRRETAAIRSTWSL